MTELCIDTQIDTPIGDISPLGITLEPPYYIWDDLESYDRNKEQFINFLINKLYFKRTEELYYILSITDIRQLCELKRYYNNKNNSSPIVKPPTFEPIDDLDNYGWSIYNAKYIKFCMSILSETLVPKSLQHIGTNILFYIKSQFNKFYYLNILEYYAVDSGNYKCKLYKDICELLALDADKMYNFTQNRLLLINKLYNKISFITISNICRFENLHEMIIQIYKILSFGGFLLIKDFDIVSEDQKYLHNTFYDLYRTICDGVPIEHVLENKKTFLYLSSIQYIELFSQFGFEIVAKNTPAPTRWVFNDSYLLFIKMKH